MAKVAWRLIVGLVDVGVANEAALPVEAPVFCGLKGGGGVPLGLAGPKTSSKLLSLKDLIGGEKGWVMWVLPGRLKKGLVPLAVDSAGLAT